MAWMFLLVAGGLEVVWAYFMKESHGFSRLWPSVITIVAMIASFGGGHEDLGGFWGVSVPYGPRSRSWSGK